jgi:alpha-L-fucosidase
MQFLRLHGALCALLSLLPSLACAAIDETPAQRDARLKWWRDARFGLFIHWGPVSLRGTEIGWSRGAQVPADEYDQLYRRFNPTNFNADAWARLARDTGMKYLVLTSKHHDGFCLWESQFTDYDIMNTPFRRDVVKELAAACRKHGIVFCAYHSICDWRHPDYPLGSPGGKTPKPDPDMDRYNSYLKNQLGELLGNYGRLGILWFDGEWEKPWTHERGVDLYQWVRGLQPRIIVNNRVGIGRSGMGGTTEGGAFGGDYDTPEQRVGNFQNDRPWESCITLCQQWAWKPDDQMKSLQECLRTLIYCAGGDGNLLFNVGPMPDGEIEPRQVDRLREMGAWMKRFGHTLRKTRGGPFKPGKWGASTHRGNRIFLHVFNWPADGLNVPLTGRKVRVGKLLTGGSLEWKRSGDNIWLNVPPADRHPVDTLIELRLDGPAADVTPVVVGRPSLARGAQAAASNVYLNEPAYAPAKAFDGDSQTRWATDAGTRQAWLEVDLGRPRTFSRAAIDEWAPGGRRVQSFELQCLSGEEWKVFLKGTTIGPDCEQKFPPVTAQHVRLNILDATEGPTISEFELRAE